MVLGEIWSYSLLSVFLISLISFIGIFSLKIGSKKLNKILIYLVSFSAGALLGDVFIHLLPEISEDGFSLMSGIYVLFGLAIFFVLEKFIHWQHCHSPIDKEHIHPFSYIVLFGDAVHNFIDGLIIGASYLVSIPAGIATTIAVALHEIPQEIGDFGILVHGGFKERKALLLNFLSGLFAVVGAIVSLLLVGKIEGFELILVPIAAGGFLYIAGSDLIPELHKHSKSFSSSLIQFVFFVLGILIMGLLLLLEI